MDTPAPEAPFDERIQWRLPQTVGPFAYSKQEAYAQQDHGVSYTYTLGRGEAVATLYVYDFGIKDLPGDVKHQRVVSTFVEILRGIAQSCQSGKRRLLQMEGNAEVRRNAETGREFLFNHHVIEEEDQQTGSVATLTVERGNFVKVRLSYAASHPLARQMSEAFVYGIHHLLFTKPRPEA